MIILTRARLAIRARAPLLLYLIETPHGRNGLRLDGSFNGERLRTAPEVEYANLVDAGNGAVIRTLDRKSVV